MEQLSSKLKGKKVFDPQGNPVCSLKSAIIDPTNGKILGLLCNTGSNLKVEILTPLDIKSWQEDKIILYANYQLHASSELVRVERVLKDNIKIKGKRVVNTAGQSLGYVGDLILNTEAYMLQSLLVKRRLFGFIPFEERIIQQKDIVEITKKAVIVKDTLVKIPLFQKASNNFSEMPV